MQRPANTTLFARMPREDSSRAVARRMRGDYVAKQSENGMRGSTRRPIFSKRTRKSPTSNPALLQTVARSSSLSNRNACASRCARRVPLRQSSTAVKSTAVHNRRAEISSSVTALCISLLTCAVMFPILPPCSSRIPIASGLTTCVGASGPPICGASPRRSALTEARGIARLGGEKRRTRRPNAEACGATTVRMHPIVPCRNNGVPLDAG